MGVGFLGWLRSIESAYLGKMNRASCGSIALVTFEKAKTLDPGLRRDDGGNFTVTSKTIVIPAQAGIQCLSLCTC